MRGRRARRVDGVRPGRAGAGPGPDRPRGRSACRAGGGRGGGRRPAGATGRAAAISTPCSARTSLAEAAVERLAGLGVTVHAERRGETRRAFDARRRRPRAHDHDARARSCGRAGRCRSRATTPSSSSRARPRRSARPGRRRFLAATPREVPTLLEAGVALDLLVGSGSDPGERYAGGLEVGVLVATDGARGGVAERTPLRRERAARAARRHLRRGRLLRGRALFRARPRRRARGRARAGSACRARPS